MYSVAVREFTEEQWDIISRITSAENYVEAGEASSDLIDTFMTAPRGGDQKLRIYVNRTIKGKATANKIAAHAVHAALTAFGVHPGGKVIVLDKGPTALKEMRVVIHDAGHTELEPGTLTAGTNWPEDSEG